MAQGALLIFVFLLGQGITFFYGVIQVPRPDDEPRPRDEPRDEPRPRDESPDKPRCDRYVTIQVVQVQDQASGQLLFKSPMQAYAMWQKQDAVYMNLCKAVVPYIPYAGLKLAGLALSHSAYSFEPLYGAEDRPRVLPHLADG